MKPRLLPFLYSLLLLAGLLTACNPSGKDNQQLASVEQLLDSGRVDTACAVLDGIRLNRLTTPADSAYYYLLKTQADYRTNHPLVSLDDIEYSIRYYEGKGSEKLRLSASLFYKSAILYTHGSFKEGVLCLERARTIADQTQDAVLRHKVYEQLTLVNEEAGDFRTALRFSQKSIAESKQAKRLDWLAHTYNNMAFIYSQLGPAGQHGLVSAAEHGTAAEHRGEEPPVYHEQPRILPHGDRHGHGAQIPGGVARDHAHQSGLRLPRHARCHARRYGAGHEDVARGPHHSARHALGGTGAQGHHGVSVGAGRMARGDHDGQTPAAALRQREPRTAGEQRQGRAVGV